MTFGPIVVGAAEVLLDARHLLRRESACRSASPARPASTVLMPAICQPPSSASSDRAGVRSGSGGRGRTAGRTRSWSCCCTAGDTPDRPKSASRLWKSCGAGKLPFGFSSEPAPLSLVCDSVSELEQRHVAPMRQSNLRLERVVARLAAVERVGDVGELRDRPARLQRQRAGGVVGRRLVEVGEQQQAVGAVADVGEVDAARRARARAAPRRTSSARRLER